MNATTLNIHQGTMQDGRFMDDRYVAPRVNAPNTSSMLEETISGITDFFDRTTQSSFEAWKKTDQTRYL